MRRLGETVLLGSGAVAMLLLLASMAGIPWSRTLVIALWSAGVLAGWLGGVSPPLPGAGAGTAPSQPAGRRRSVLDLVTLALIVGYARIATLAPPVESDFYGIWGVKAKQFFMTGGIDWRFLDHPLNVPAHVDYPILLPLLYDAFALLLGRWPDERWLGLIHVATGVAALLVIRGMLADEMPKLARAAATLIVMPFVFSPYFGLPEGLLAAYGTVALLFLRRAVRDDDSAASLHGAIYLGLAASCKNEGLALIAAAALALVVARRWRLLPRLWPAIAIVLPWMLLRWQHRLPTDLARSGMFDRVLEHVAHPALLFDALRAASFGRPLFWCGLALALVLGARRLIREERFLTIAIVTQLLFFIGAYLVTPNDLASHVQVTWERIVRQVLPAAVLLALLSTVIRFRAEDR